MYCGALQCWQTTEASTFCQYHRDILHVRRSGNYHAEWRFKVESFGTKEVGILEGNIERIEIVPVNAIRVQFFKNNVPTFHLFKNPYHTKNDDFMLLEWYDNKFLFNDKHGCISVFDAETGVCLHKSMDTDMFITEYALFDNRRYLYTAGWMWQPMIARELFDVETLLTTPDYEPRKISTIDQKEWSGTHPGIYLFGFETCAELIERHDEVDIE